MDIVVTGSEISVMSMTRKRLHELLRGSTKRLLDEKFKELQDKLLDITKCPVEKHDELSKIIKSFKVVYKRKWLACNSTEARFLQNNDEWLSEDLSLPAAGQTPGNSKGRPSKQFWESSERSKRRKTMELRMNVPADELTYAAQMSRRASGNVNAAKVIQDLSKSPTRASKLRKASVLMKTTVTKKHTPEEAASICVEADLTVSQYEVIHQANKDVYPCYTYVQRAKQECYPPKIVTKTGAEVKLQDLVDHTAQRLCKYLAPVLQQSVDQQNSEIVLMYKWGCDGSTQSQYKQKFEEDNNSDANIFLSSLVPLRLLLGNKVIWQNPQPSSPRFCRPIRFRFVKEDKDVTNEEIHHIENQAKNLETTRISHNVLVKHVLFPTMVDGKVCNSATNTKSTLRCYICAKTSKHFNDLISIKPEKPETFKFGLSILHARIRFFEFVLHLSYKVQAKVHKGRITEKNDKDEIEKAKISMQNKIREKLGLLVDIPKVGYGNTNDGNSSRNFFNNPDEAAAITGIDLRLINNFKIILEVLAAGFDIELEKFSLFTMDTARLYVSLYPWQPMSPTVHKILMHAPSVIAHALLPIGQLSEEAAEARNKHFRQYRESFSRKFSRRDCNEDVINRLLLTSDPYLSNIRPKNKKKKQSFSQEALEFFQCVDDSSCSPDE